MGTAAKKTKTSRLSSAAKNGSRKLGKKKKSKKPKIHGELSSIPKLFWKSLKFYIRHWKQLGFIIVLHSIILVILLRSAEAVSIEGLENLVTDTIGESLLVLPLTAAIALTVGEQASSAFTLVTMSLFILSSLASIWMIRRMYAGQTFALRDAFYRGMYPLIPFMMLGLLIFLQSVPFFAGSLVFSVLSLGELVSGLVQIPLLIGWAALAALSGYMISLTVMSLYAVTLPDMRPLDATRAVRRVIEGKRWKILARILAMLIFAGLFLLAGFIGFVAVRPSFAFEGLDIMVAMLGPFIHVYLFHIYKEMV